MSTLNLQWLSDNFSYQSTVIFDIGCANMNGDTVRVRQLLPNAKIIAFECESRWEEINRCAANQHNIDYYHVAISDQTGQELFRPSVSFKGDPWGYSGNLSNVDNTTNDDKLVWGEPYLVNTVTINDFCSHYNVFPDFIHIDTEGSEYKIFSNLNTTIRPKAIWSEVTEYHDDRFDKLLEKYGYLKAFTDGVDALYVLPNCGLSTYYNLTLKQQAELDYIVSSKLWLQQYNLVRGIDWPDLESLSDFYALPNWIQDECINVFNLTLPNHG